MPFDTPPFECRQAILLKFKNTRKTSEQLALSLTPEDWMLQSMLETSPVKWNLAHTSWFFETFILQIYQPDYKPFHPKFGYLFNSYYNQIGKMYPRSDRGMISRPSAKDILEYRQYVTDAIAHLVDTGSVTVIENIAPIIALGISHEEQHQELLLTDIKHCLFQNPLLPAVYEESKKVQSLPSQVLKWEHLEGGLCEIGNSGEGFSFDNEGPRHKVYLHPFEFANRPVTNGEYINFIDDGGYDNPVFWLADAWEMIKHEGWRAPLYWREVETGWCEYSLFGERALNLQAPVCHVSFYEVTAYANWAQARLPTEFEWEAAASLYPREGNFLVNAMPSAPAPSDNSDRLGQLYGDVWEWTASPYVPYPGFVTPEGAVGEYNGKFMSGQMVLKGGSCATPKGHMRDSYRNFLAPQARWQFSGFRLARDCA